jgi:hypothetical protein
VEDAIKGRTKPTRTDKWIDEVHDFGIDKANEIEITVYDKTGDHLLPIGMLWVRISDIVEEMRRKKIESDLQNSGWVSADMMGGNAGGIQVTLGLAVLLAAQCDLLRVARNRRPAPW